MLSMAKGFKLLQKYRIPVAKYAVAKSESSALKAAKRIGYPAALKADDPKIIHKTEAGVVAYCLENEAELRKAFKKIRKKTRAPVIVQEHCHGREVIIGGKLDPQFGHVVLFGLGGIFVETFRDVALRVTPITRRDAEEMIKEIKAYPLLAGARGEKPVKTTAITDAILKTAKLLEDKKIRELDINPLFATEDGIKAVDVRVIA